MISNRDLESLLDVWEMDTAIHSFKWTILRGEAFDEIKTEDPKRLIPVLLKRIRDKGPWMGYIGFLQDLTKEDIWSGREVAPGWRGYNVKETAEAWLKWGQKKGYIDHTNHNWIPRGQREDICLKCRQKPMELKMVQDNKEARVFEWQCADCGVIERTIQAGKLEDRINQREWFWRD